MKNYLLIILLVILTGCNVSNDFKNTEAIKAIKVFWPESKCYSTGGLMIHVYHNDKQYNVKFVFVEGAIYLCPPVELSADK